MSSLQYGPLFNNLDVQTVIAAIHWCGIYAAVQCLDVLWMVGCLTLLYL